MPIKLDLRTKTQGPHTTLIDPFPFVCTADGKRFFTAREIIKHIQEERVRETAQCPPS